MYSAGASIVPSLVTFKQGDQETFLQRPAVLTLTFDHVTSKSIWVMYSLGDSIGPSLATFSGQRLVYRPTYQQNGRPTGAKQYATFFQRGIKIG